MVLTYLPFITAALIVIAVYNLIYRPIKKRSSDDECRSAIDRIRREEEEEVRRLAHELSR